jgi:hypothetical protein
VRQLKSDKADKATVDAAVALLLDLKAKYKSATGSDWKPGSQPAKAKQEPQKKESTPPKKESTPPGETSSVADQLNLDIIAQGDKVGLLFSINLNRVLRLLIFRCANLRQIKLKKLPLTQPLMFFLGLKRSTRPLLEMIGNHHLETQVDFATRI